MIIAFLNLDNIFFTVFTNSAKSDVDNSSVTTYLFKYPSMTKYSGNVPL